MSKNQRGNSRYLSPKKQNPNRKKAKRKRQRVKYLDLELNL